MIDNTIDSDVIGTTVTGTSGPTTVGGNTTRFIPHTYHTPPRAQSPYVPPVARRTSFGRDHELMGITPPVTDRQNALIRGQSGAGKTALAGAVAQYLHEQVTFEHGILWISEVGAVPTAATCDATARCLDGEDKARNVWASLNPSYASLTDDQRYVFTHLAACFSEPLGGGS